MSDLVDVFSWRFGDWELDERTRELRRQGVLVEVEPKCFDFLLVLLQRTGEIITVSEFQELVWPGRIVAESAVTNIVCKLRKALGDEDQELIRTVPKAGYRLTAAVQRSKARRATIADDNLKAGDWVPGRTQWQLLEALDGCSHAQVWLAEHAKTHEKRVFKFCFDHERLSALKREVTVYRLMQDALPARDGYLRILEWNFENPPFFIESPYAGRNLRAWLEDRGGIAAIPLAERIELIAMLAEDLAAAHSIGVLHKDLKPENVLIDDSDGQRRVRLADFGAAHLLDSKSLSQLGITQLGFSVSSLVDDSTTGTLIYMAPELFMGGVPSVQSDIYSLGVMLYQLVAGKFGGPLAPGWESDIDDELLRQDIVDATHGSCERRLPSAQLLAERLRQLGSRRAEQQQQRIEQQRAAEAFESIKRAKARRPWIIAAVVVAIVGAVLGIELFREKQQQVRMTEAVNHFLTDDILRAANPQNGGSKDMTVLAAVRQSLPQVQQRFSGEPEIEAALDASLGVVFRDLSEYPEALKEFRREVSLDTTLYGPNDVRTLIAQVHVADVMFDTQEWQAGVDLFSQALPTLVKKLNADDPRLLYARYVEARMDYLENNWTGVAERVGKLVDDCTRLIPDSDLTIRAEQLYLLSLTTAGFDGARVLEAEARKQIDQSARRFGANNFRTVSIGVALGRALATEGRHAEAEQVLQQTKVGLIGLVGPDHREVVRCNFELYRLYANENRWTEASTMELENWRWAQHELGDTARFTIQQQAMYAGALDHLGRTNEALPYAEAAYAQATQTLNSGDIAHADTRFVLGFVYVHLGRFEDARRVADEYRKITSAQPFVGQPELRDWIATSHLLDAEVALVSGDVITARREAQLAKKLSEQDHETSDVADAADFLKTLDSHTQPAPLRAVSTKLH